MSTDTRTILFLCTGNSARSILAEALVNSLPICRDRFRAYSAGSQPTGRVNPFAIALLQSHGIATENLRSKSWDEFAGPTAPTMHFVFTVCDSAAGEQCPYWPGQPLTAHWGIPDPAAVAGSDDDKRKAFQDAWRVLRRRIELFASLPFATLDHANLQQRIKQIGNE